ncbi:Imm44 family immunity protein [Taylorella equigenitalis]|uniref:Uncharacterized protein n=2 Tax=Taylorella equigenitalis TaxID=29575 RepID=A0A654KJC9_TAYEM|nr:Imm44 family immunity protein [Taylorella equigenitalis]ADU92510.1 hypothetical protein TEQUI_1598 [Taylorella equigenitalis MCE9]AFN36058.1 hypothetical protein KUI_0987 [Taylorella equigenitalis ATCC 35865]ASY37995.1 hypothetical protein CA605_04730 [Taylorella equigenitalis]ASY39472.1 hypothetical protein CA604_04960 [Taylorella equigenitalis]ASY42417.1 hypothetical protein CA943_04745 [Taylorella equigenitalis]
MRLWISAEAEHTVGSEFIKIANEIEKIVNFYLEDKKFSDEYKDWCWAYIAMLEGPVMESMELPEITRRSIKKQDLEFRFKIDYHSFLNGDYNQRLKLIIDSLDRCLEHPKMKSPWKVPKGDIIILKEALRVAEQKLTKN